MDVTDVIRHHDNLPHRQRPEGTYFLRCSTQWDTAGLLTAHRAVTEVIVASLRHDEGLRYEMHCWVLMPDHLHMILRPLPRGDGFVPIPEIMQALKGASAHGINRLLGRRGAFWLDEYFDHEIRSAREYSALKHYIWLNPWRAGLVAHPSEWPWYWERGG